METGSLWIQVAPTGLPDPGDIIEITEIVVEANLNTLVQWDWRSSSVVKST